MELDSAIQSRRSRRKYSNKKPDWRDIIECIDACRYAPMAGDNFTLKFIVIDDPATIQTIAEASQQDFVNQANYVVVVCTDPKRTQNSYPEFADKFLKQQAGAAIQNFLLKAEENNLATCWIGFFAEEIIKRELRIPDHTTVEALFPIGKPSGKIGQKPKSKKRIDIDRILYFYKYGNKKMKKIRKLNV